jgi:uncharacterized protein YaiI (UPF0178 family)
MKKTTLFVDADACPVTEEIRQITARFGVPPVFVASYAGYRRDDHAEEKWIYVDQEKEAADLYIVNHACRGDAAVTQDMGLASLLTGRGISVLSIYGKQIRDQDIPQILHKRYLSYKSLQSGRKIRGPRRFSDRDRKNFSFALTNLLCRLIH